MALPPAAPAFNLAESNLDPLALPDNLPEGVVPNVPFPKEDYPEWTTTLYDNVDVPQTFQNFIRLPENPREHPALYAAAIDTMRATNDYFWQQRGIGRDSLTEGRVARWHGALNMPHNVLYTRPPDYRTMFVEENVNRNLLENGPRPLWMQACDDVAGMRDDEWEERLTWTRDRVRENTRRTAENGPGDAENGLGDAENGLGDAENGPGDAENGAEEEHEYRRGLFMRYLVWNEFIAGTTARSQNIQEDTQPDLEQLNMFFYQTRELENGVTLADICHAFPRARNTEMLVYRIERFANLRTYPDEPSPTGAMEPVESRYIPKPNPTQEDLDRIQVTVQQEGFVTLFGLANRYYPSPENVKLITTALKEVAVPNSTERRFFANAAVALVDDGDESYVHGVTIEELRERFTDRDWDLNWLPVFLEEYMYFDEREGRYFTLYLREDSILERNRYRIDLTWNPATVQDVFRWDRDRVQYVQQEPPIVENPAAAPGAAADEGDGPEGDDSEGDGPSSRTRGVAKRKARGPPRPARAVKQARAGHRVQCSGTTRANVQCRRTKAGAPGEVWDCGLHGRRRRRH